ncbi:MAG: aminoacyl-tRNA hydrolase [Oscillospiraceae bacterium]|nr:aminoacyl-tRNA hydrolase [Oscillospiraceae bacterium]
MFFGRKNEPVSWLVVFLGNPGDKYDNTRHNAGFRAADVLEKKTGERLKKIKYQSLLADLELGGQRILAMKPQTYMNLSGEAVAEAARFYKIPADHILVVCDDISLKPGVIRLRKKGSAGGHNGLKSIIQQLGTDQFPRIKMGVGAKPHPDYDLAAWVLGKFPAEDAKLMDDAAVRAVNAAEMILKDGFDKAQNRFSK